MKEHTTLMVEWALIIINISLYSTIFMIVFPHMQVFHTTILGFLAACMNVLLLAAVLRDTFDMKIITLMSNVILSMICLISDTFR